MYNNVKLDKSLYNISGKSFTQVLSELDPDSNYVGTELANLDAYERQLKRFNIRISGEDCDVVDKFFHSTESAVLFPEFIKRCVTAGVEGSFISDIVAVNSTTDGIDYRGFNIGSYTPYSITINETNEIPESSIKTSAAINLKKYARLITSSYEAIKGQKLDLYACTLKAVGRLIGNELVNLSITTLKTDATTVAGTSGGFVYTDLLNLYKSFSKYDLTCLVASPATCAALLALPELAECTSEDGGASVQLPFGPKLYKAKGYTGTDIIGLDKGFALEMVTNSSGIVIETDKAINRQIDRITVSLFVNFLKIIPAASMVLTYTE